MESVRATIVSVEVFVSSLSYPAQNAHAPYCHLLPSRLYSIFPLYTVCPTRYRTRHFFNNANTNEDIATKFEQEYVRCVRNVSVVRFKFRCNILVSGKIIKEMPALVASGTRCIIKGMIFENIY